MFLYLNHPVPHREEKGSSHGRDAFDARSDRCGLERNHHQRFCILAAALRLL
jgi:hypothetical protein